MSTEAIAEAIGVTRGCRHVEARRRPPADAQAPPGTFFRVDIATPSHRSLVPVGPSSRRLRFHVMGSVRASPGQVDCGTVDVPEIPRGEVARLFALARRALVTLEVGSAGLNPVEYGGDMSVEIVLSVFERYAERVPARGRGPSLEAAVCDGARRAARDPRVACLNASSDVLNLGLELWVLTDRQRLRGSHGHARIELGLDGIELRVGARSASCMPSAALVRHFANPERLMSTLARRAGLPADAWSRPDAMLWRTHWDHYVDLPGIGRTVRLRRLRPIKRRCVDRRTVVEGLERAQNRLLHVQDADGLYAYRYKPFHGRVLGGSPNTVRQAGCAYAMSWSAMRESSAPRAMHLAESASRALAWLFARARSTPDGGMFFEEAMPTARRGKLGTMALALLALQDGPLFDRHRQERLALTAGVLARRAADGSFRCFADSTSPLYDGASQNYFPGEALLALAHAARRGDATAEAEAAGSFAFYRDYFRRAPTTAFVLWHAAAWRVLCEDTAGGPAQDRRDQYAQFVIEIVDWLIRHQLDDRSAPRPEFVGGFVINGTVPGCSTATYTEAVIHGYAVAQLLDDTERVARYGESACRGLGFVLGLQVSRESATLCPEPPRVAGATTKSPTDFLLRSDFDQHTITAFLTAIGSQGLLG